jgi:hypothetical protein
VYSADLSNELSSIIGGGLKKQETLVPKYQVQGSLLGLEESEISLKMKLNNELASLRITIVISFLVFPRGK